jgi:flagellar protein FliS
MQNAGRTYWEEDILQAETLKLVQLLYRAAIEAVADARRFLALGLIRDRSRQISRACEILSELHHGLDVDRGGELAARLEQLYEYMQRRLLEANLHQTDGPLDDVETLLRTLLEAWDQCDQKALISVPAGAARPEQTGSIQQSPTDASGWSTAVNGAPIRVMSVA